MAGQLNKALSLTDILQGGYPPSHPETAEQTADAALVARDWQRAVEAYEQCKDAAADLRVDEKRGWCLGKKQAWTEALAALAPHRNELSSAGLTMLAIASVGGWAARYKRDDSARAEFDATLAKALADEAPAYLTYAALFWFRHYRQDEEALLAHARKAVSLYPDEPYLRLKLADCLSRKHGDETEICAVLKAGLGANSTTEYLWTYAVTASRLGCWEDALAQLDRALIMTQANGDSSRHTALQMQLERAELLVSAGRTEEAVKTYRELAAMDMAEAGYVVHAARRGLLAIACRADKDEQIRQALKEWLAVVIASFDRYQISDLLVGECEPIYFFDGDVGSCVSGESLIPHRERLLEAAEGSERGMVRFLFAECERESDDYDTQAFANSMLQAERETDSPVILGALAAAYAIKKRPNWQSAGSAWTRHELHRLSGNTSTYSLEPLSEDDPPSNTAIEAYAKGMRKEFQAAAPSPHLAKIFATLRRVLIDKKMHRVFRDMAELVVSGLEDPDAIFDAALGAHWCKDQARAIELYWEVLSRNKTHYSALHNLLLLYRSPKHAVDVERVAQLVEAFPVEDSNRRDKLLGILDEARAACRDPQEAARNAIRAELMQYPALIQRPIKAARVPLQDAVTLVTLLEMCEEVEGGLVYQPFDRHSLPFSPTKAS